VFTWRTLQHKVTISKPFAVGRSAIMRSEFAAFVSETKQEASGECLTPGNGKIDYERVGLSFRNPGFAQDDQHPVVCVNWDDAKVFGAWLSKKTGKTVPRLKKSLSVEHPIAGDELRAIKR